MRKKVFLTGGAGRVGRRLLKLLLDREYNVKALIHRHKPEGITSDNLELIPGDLLDQEGLKKAVKGCQIICHIAAAFDLFGSPVFEKENNQLFENITRGTYNLLEAANTVQNLDLFLYASTDAVYLTGGRKFEAPVTEDTELFPQRFYALMKIMGEVMCINYGKLYSLPWSIIRVDWALAEDDVLKIFEYKFWESSLDPDDRKRLEPKLANSNGVFAPLFSNGESAIDHITDPDDTANGFLLAIEKYEKARNNIFNIAGPAPFRYLDVIEKVAKGLGVPWASARVNGLEPYEISNEKARQILGYQPKYTTEQMIDKALAKEATGKN